MTKTNIGIGALALLAIGLVLGVLGQRSNQVNVTPDKPLGGTVYDQSNLVGDVYQGIGGVLMMQSGVFVGPINTANTVTFSGEVTLGNCGTASWNPSSIATSTLASVATTSIALTGAALGDVCLASLTSATSSDAQVTCVINSAATSTIQIVNLGASALDLATGTAKVCYFD